MLNNSYYIHIIRVPFFFFIPCHQIKIVTVYHSAIYHNLLLYFLVFDRNVRFTTRDNILLLSGIFQIYVYRALSHNCLNHFFQLVWL